VFQNYALYPHMTVLDNMAFSLKLAGVAKEQLQQRVQEAAGILYDESNAVAAGGYTLSATFTEIGAPPNHREGLGLIFGGADLQGANQHYSYFLVRADGKYNIIRRMGDTTASVTGGWMDSAAIVAARGDADVTNTLEVQVMGDMVHFRVNGTEVTTVPAADLDVHGIAGLRINHNLNVHVTGWSLTTS